MQKKVNYNVNNNSKNKDAGQSRKKISRNSIFSPKLNFNTITTVLNDKYLRTEINPFDDTFIKKKINPRKLKRQLININDDDKVLNIINNTSDSLGNITSHRMNQTNYILLKSTNDENLKKINNANKSKILNYTKKKQGIKWKFSLLLKQYQFR